MHECFKQSGKVAGRAGWSRSDCAVEVDLALEGGFLDGKMIEILCDWK